MSKLIKEIEKWSKIYEFSFQFWPDQNNVWIYKDGVEFAFFNRPTMKEVLEEACKYVRGLNPPKKDHYRIPNIN